MSDIKIYNGADINVNYTASATVRQFGKIRNLVSLFALALLFAGAALTVRAQPTPTPNPNMEMGIVTGGIYSWKSAGEGKVLEQALLDRADEIFKEFKGLGGKWIRIEANWLRNYDEQYTFIADKAHSYGLKVIVVLTTEKPQAQGTPFCHWQQQGKDRDIWFNNYVTELNRLATEVFFSRNLINAQADAYEIMNEPNQFNDDSDECKGTGRFRMDGDSFAWLMRFVWRWKNNNGRPEKIISGGTINSYHSEPWWGQFFGSGALDPVYGERPFDYFGVHPYNEATPNYSRTAAELREIVRRINERTSSSDTQIFVTEFGIGSITQPPTALTEDAAVAWMNTAFTTFGASGVVKAALWYDYRDDHLGGMGLRSGWDSVNKLYPAKLKVWRNFRAIAGGTGSDDPEYYWQSWLLPNRPPYGFLDYANTTSIGGWAYDPDTVNPIDVDIYIDGLRVGTVKADGYRPDLVTAGVAPNRRHGYTFPTPYLSPGCHTVTAVAINHRGGTNPTLPSAKQICR